MGGLHFFIIENSYENYFKEFIRFCNNEKKYCILINDIKILDNSKINKKLQIKNQKEIGFLLGEKIKKIAKNRYIIKATTGIRYISSSQVFKKKTTVNEWAKVALDPSSFSIMKILPNNIDPIIDKMINYNNETTKFQCIGGLKIEIEKLREIIELPLTNPEIFYQTGIKIPKGILLFGPPGTGKTLLAKSIALNVKSTFLKMVGSGIIDKYIGESARIIREIFSFAKKNNPCIIFIDEVDAIGGRRFSEGTSADREIQRTLIELLNQLDGFEELLKIKVIMATNRPDVLDPALLRPGRLDRKLKIDLPNLSGRFEIFKIYFRMLYRETIIDFDKVMRVCEFFNGSDLRNLCTEAGFFAARSHRNFIKEEDLIKAAKKIKTSKKFDQKNG